MTARRGNQQARQQQAGTEREINVPHVRLSCPQPMQSDWRRVHAALAARELLWPLFPSPSPSVLGCALHIQPSPAVAYAFL